MLVQGKDYVIADDVKEIAEQVIAKEKLGFIAKKDAAEEAAIPTGDDVKIGYLKIYDEISKTVHARIRKASRELKFYSSFDYIIEVSGIVWDELDEDTRYKLIFHELLHIELGYKKDGEVIYKLRNHDLQDFKTLVNRYGADWFDVYKETISQVYDMDPEETNSIKHA